VGLWSAIATYARVRSFRYRVRTPEALAAWQARKLANWLKHDVPQVDAFAGPVRRLEDLPIMEKADLMADFARYNVPRITNDQGWAAFAGDKQIGDNIVGASTGTSGNRGLFVISQAERFAWLGAILAKAIPDFWRHRDRVAILLPLDTPLYDSANQTGRLKLQFIDINDPFEQVGQALTAFNPTIIVAPPRILRACVAAQLPVAPRRIFTAAETCDPLDRDMIEAGFKQRLGEIYMATEGLLAVTCAHGRLHLAQDCLHFELEPVGDGLVTPIISDFSRKTQIMARYRMNDLLRLDPDVCPCGSPLQVVSEVVGRQDDVFHLGGDDGTNIMLTPDILRNAIVDADRRIDDFRLVQTGPNAVALYLAHDLDPSAKTAARDAVLALLTHRNCTQTQLEVRDLSPHDAGKLRRIRRDWQPDITRPH